MKDRDSGESKGYAFVAFKTKDAAQRAIEELHSKEFKVISAANYSLTYLSLLVYSVLISDFCTGKNHKMLSFGN